jgi:hypothetical protein
LGEPVFLQFSDDRISIVAKPAELGGVWVEMGFEVLFDEL